MLSIPSERALASEQLAAIRAVDRAARQLEYFVAGAMARDILLTHVYGLPLRRATRDIDFAVAVRDWSQVETLKSQLVERSGFERDRMVHRVTIGGFPVDIIPFGGVESQRRTVAWPREINSVMNVAGFDEALNAAETVRLCEGLEIPVASLSGLAVLKLFAWNDRGQENSKDASDFLILLQNYAEAGNEDRLYGDALDVLETVEHQWQLAGARLLGRDVHRLARADTRTSLIELLAEPKKRDRLTTHMAREHGSTTEEAITTAEILVEQFERGLTEG